MPKYSKNGFTLVELLVVITVIAVLATVGVVTYSGVQRTARDSRRMEDLREAQKALEQYYATNGSYPIQGGTAGGVLNNVTALNAYFGKGVPPTDAVNNAEYYYGYFAPCGSNTSVSYLMCVKLESCGNNCSVVTYPPPYVCPIVPATTGTKQYFCVSNLQGG